MRALVVDDELTTRTVLQRILSQYGEVDTCINGSDAFEAYRTALESGSPYHLICLDLAMPVMGGLEVLDRIRAMDQSLHRYGSAATKIVMTTGSGDGESVDLAFSRECDAYIVKPIDATVLVDLLQCLFPLEANAR